MKLLAYDQAIKSCDSVIKLQPNNVKALFRKGQALESKKDTAEALVYFKVSLAFVPSESSMIPWFRKMAVQFFRPLFPSSALIEIGS